MRTAALSQLGRIHLDPSLNATSVYLDPSFLHQFRDVLVRERVAKVEPHARNDQFTRVLPPFEWVTRGDRHRLLPLPRLRASKLRNGTRPRLARLHGYLLTVREQVLPKSEAGQAIAYTLKNWTALARLISDNRKILLTTIIIPYLRTS